MGCPVLTEGSKYSYDVFVSYSSSDEAWVHNWLLPQLEAAGLQVCIDFRDFDIGVPRIINIERAVDNSRHTLLVLTPAWVESKWNEFQSLLVQTSDPAGRQRQLLPLLLQRCQPPRRIASLTYADFRNEKEWVAQLERVLAAVQGEITLRDVGPQLTRLLSRETLFLAPSHPPYELVGREELLHDLKRQLLVGGILALSALNGLPGVGKTALAIELAHDPEVLAYFKDGVLWVGLGCEPDVLALLGTWGAALGLPAEELAELTSVEERARAIHMAIGTRCILLVVDDAWQVESALAFRLGGPNCAHIVTTRLPEVALHFGGGSTTVVHELNEDDGLALLQRLAPAVVGSEPEQARELVRAVGGLPLALILMGNYLRVQAHNKQPRRLQAALDRLQRTEERLQLAEPQAPSAYHPSLPAGAWVSLPTVIGISDRELDMESRNALRALAVFPPKPNTFSEAAALAVCSITTETLDTLVDYGLLETSGPGRYTLHQAIADYAEARLADETVYERMVEYFVQYAEVHEPDYLKLEQEFRNIVASLHVAFEKGMSTLLVRGVNALYQFMETRGLYALAEDHLERAERTARSQDSPLSLATTLLNLGKVTHLRGRADQAQVYLQKGLSLARKMDHRESISALLLNLGITMRGRNQAKAKLYLQEGLTLARELGHSLLICTLLFHLGGISLRRGELVQAYDLLSEGLIVAREIGNSQLISVLFQSLGGIAAKRGDYIRAKQYYREALDLARQIGDRKLVCLQIHCLGWVAREQGDYKQAEIYLLEALALARKIGHLYGISIILQALAGVKFRQEAYTKAEEHFEEALALAQEIAHHWLISTILNRRGRLYLNQQRLEVAYADFSRAFELARELDDQEEMAVALYGIARVRAIQGNIVEARRLGQSSLSILDEIGFRRADEVKQWLRSLRLASTSEEGTVDGDVDELGT